MPIRDIIAVQSPLVAAIESDGFLDGYKLLASQKIQRTTILVKRDLESIADVFAGFVRPAVVAKYSAFLYRSRWKIVNNFQTIEKRG
jgi:hypothetical protein